MTEDCGLGVGPRTQTTDQWEDTGSNPVDRKCHVCETKDNLVQEWGKWVCRKCYMERPHKKGGNSGMIRDDKVLGQMPLPLFDDLTFIKVGKGEKRFSTLYLTHYPGSKGICGRSQNYIILYKNQLAGIIGFNSPPQSIADINKYFNINKDNRKTKLSRILNNNVYRLIVSEPNLASRVLSQIIPRLKKDYEKSYGDRLIGLMTFVEPPRDGRCYKASGWTYVGETKGFSCKRGGREGKWMKKQWSKSGVKKLIYVESLHRYYNK